MKFKNIIKNEYKNDRQYKYSSFILWFNLYKYLGDHLYNFL